MSKDFDGSSETVADIMKEISKSEFPESDLLISELKSVIQILARRRENGRAAWRLADAAGRLRSILESEGHTDLCGLDYPTGLGFILPRKNGKEVKA